MKNKPAWAQTKTVTPVAGRKPYKAPNALVSAISKKSKSKLSDGTTIKVNAPEPTYIDSKVNYMQVLEDSHFWTDLDMLKNFLNHLPASNTRDYLLKGVENTIKNGYTLVQTDKPLEPGSFATTIKQVQTTKEPISIEKFRLVLATQQPKELYHSYYSSTAPLFIVTSYAVGAQREADWYVRGYYSNWVDKTPRKVTLSNLYRSFRIQGLAQWFFKA